MLPRGYLYYTFSSPLYWFLAFLTGYVLGRMQISLAASLYKLVMLVAMLFILQIIISKLRRKYGKKKKVKRPIRARPPQEYYDRLFGTEIER